MYSRWQRKIILIDFGLAKFIKEKINSKTKTAFRGTKGWVGEDMQELYSENKTIYGWVNLYKNDLEALKKTLNKIAKRYITCTTIFNETPRTEDGYYLVPFREIHEKYVQWNCHYRHVKPSPLEEEVGTHVRSYEVLVEQDDTLHEKKFRFEYAHGEKMDYTEEELKFFTARNSGIELFFMRHPDLVKSVN